MMDQEGRTWILVIALLLLGLGIAFFFAQRVHETEVRAQHSQAESYQMRAEMERLHAENEALRAQLQRGR